MKRFFIHIIMLSMLSMVACQYENSIDSYTFLSDNMSTKASNVIPKDSAIQNLIQYIADSDRLSGTRSITENEISSISLFSIKLNSDSSSIENEELQPFIYVANFKEDQGYAILAADSRIEEKVIAIVEEGSLADATVSKAIQYATEERPIIAGFPTTGDGFFTTSETGTEIFMNPNTVSLYSESEQDTLVGNFDLEEDSTTKINKFETNSNAQLFSSYLCVEYASRYLKPDNGFVLLTPCPDDEDFGSDTSSRIEVSISDWKINETISPLLTSFKGWHQSSPFNDLYPERRNYLILGKKRNAPAGCFPLAVAKIFSLFEYPNTKFGLYYIDWSVLKTDVFSDTGNIYAANLLKEISSQCKSLYFYQGTFTFPKNVVSYLKNSGYANASSKSYSFEVVTSMISSGKPVIIYSVPGINIFKSHSWNIDGYKVKERITTKTYYKNDVIIKTEETSEISNMVHCDFGWGGSCNGYYVSGVFKLDDSNIELDPGASTDKDTNYNNLLKIITYDLPNE